MLVAGMNDTRSAGARRQSYAWTTTPSEATTPDPEPALRTPDVVCFPGADPPKKSDIGGPAQPCIHRLNLQSETINLLILSREYSPYITPFTVYSFLQYLLEYIPSKNQQVNPAKGQLQPMQPGFSLAIRHCLSCRIFRN